MNAKDEAWAKVDEATDSLVDMARLVDHDSLEDAYAELWTAVDAYAALAVAEARAPLVEALKEAHAGLVAMLTIPSASAAYDDAIAAAKDGRAAAAAALAAKETP